MPLMAAPSHVSSDCPMLRHLARDTGSQFALLSLLLTTDIASLVMTCRDWSRWINEPNALGPRHHAVKLSRFADLLRCDWIRRPQRELHLLYEPTLSSDLGTTAQRQLEGALAGLGPPHFPILEELRIATNVLRVNDAVLRDCLHSLAPRLRSLNCTAIDHVQSGGTLLHALMQHVKCLVNLRRLGLTGTANPQTVSFAGLPSLPHLRLFQFRPFASNYEVWRATAEQAADLARCDKLIELQCGAWDADPLESKDEQEAAVRNKLALLSEAWRVRAQSGASCVLCLSCTRISPTMWLHIAPLRDLVDVFPLGWTEDLSAEQWAQLATFPQLGALSLTPADWRRSFDSERMLPALAQCGGLHHLRLGKTDLSAAQFALLCRSLQKLKWLDLIRVRFPVECFPLLVSLPLLRWLGLTEYASPTESVPNVRPLVPAFPQLTALRIFESSDRPVLTKDQVAADNAAILLRCPMLRPESFEQFLR